MKHKLFFILLTLVIPLGTFSQNFYTLSGTITDSQTGKELAGIDIVVENTTTGTISNYKGLYSLYLDKGDYQITYSGIGYKNHIVSVSLNTDQVQMVELLPKQKQLKRKDIKQKQSKVMEILSHNTQ